MSGEDVKLVESVVRVMLHPDDLAYLELQAEETGLTPELVVVQMVRKARKAYERPTPAPAPTPVIDPAEEHQREMLERKRQELAAKRAKLEAELAALTSELEPLAEEFDEGELPRDPDFISRPNVTVIAPPRSTGPGSLTQAAGVNPALQNGHVIGDPEGNIRRQNFGHFGTRGR